VAAPAPPAVTPPAPAAPTLESSDFVGPWSQYTVERTAEGYVVTHTTGAEPSRFVEGPRLRFVDANVALDADGVAGQVYRLYQAALDRSPDEAGVGFHMASMEHFGLSLVEIAEQFMASAEFTNRLGNLTNAQFVTQLYRNVLRREPDPAGHAFHAGNLDLSRASRAEVLIQFSESPEHKARLFPAIDNGIAYVPYLRPATAPVSPFGR
jgi:hypothetical protein